MITLLVAWLLSLVERLHTWRQARKYSRCHHSILGTHCTKCGWEMRLLMIHHPETWTLSKSFLRALPTLLPPHVEIQLVRGAYGDDHGITFHSVGWDLTKEQYAELIRHCGFSAPLPEAA